MSVLLSSDTGGVRTLTLNRPHRRNAVDPELWRKLREALAAAARDRAVRALVLTGAGGAFCSGADLKAGDRRHPLDKVRDLNEVAVLLHELPVPTVARPAFLDDGVIHAGNASQISDGAAALLVTTPERAREWGLTPIVRYRAGAVTGADRVLMLTGPIPATEKVLRKGGVGLAEIGVFEVNEAFASVPLAWLAETGADPALLNPLGGAIASGHPLGASGAVLMTRMIHHMRDHGIRHGLRTMCEGGGTANATLVELAC